MGFIEKQVRKRANQKVAEPLSTLTQLQPPEVVAVIKQAIERHNQALVEKNAQKQANAGGKVRRLLAEADAHGIPRRSYCVKVQEKDVLISYEKPVDEVLARISRKTRKPGITEGYWLAGIRMMRDEGGQNRVEIRLINWVMDSNGRLRNKDKYHELTDMIWDAVGGNAANTQQEALFP